MKKLLWIGLCLILSGCVTVSSFVKTCQQNPSMTISEADVKLGKPSRTVIVTVDVKYKVYDRFLDDCGLVAYFVNDRLYCYGYDDKYFHLDTQYNLGLISREDYKWEYEMYQQGDIADRQAALQAFGIWQGMQQSRQSAPVSKTTVIAPRPTQYIVDNSGNRVGKIKTQESPTVVIRDE